jgi:hypothetical protein
MVKRRGLPSQGWRTFLHNHAPDIAAMDLFVVPTIGFDLLYAFVIVRLERRNLVWIKTSQQLRRQNGLHVKSRKHFLGMRLRATSSAIGIGSMAASPNADCAPWASGTNLSRQALLGRTAWSNG